MVCRLLCTTLTLSCLGLEPVSSQTGPTGFASLNTVVTDSLSGKPILRIVLWNIRRSGPQNSSAYYAQSDSTGQVRLDSIPAGVKQQFQVVCEQGRMRSKRLDTLNTVLAPGEVRQWSVRTSARGCDQRPFTVHQGVFEGRWRSGFEESRFVPCDPLLPEAWVAFAPDAQTGPGVKWPEDLDKYYPEVFVRFEGQLVGPWRYGHLGVSDYQLTVNRTLEVRTPAKTHCAR
jgi:hypothetical protein